MHFSTVYEWLDWIASIHTQEIDLGLDRVKAVASRLNLLSPKAVVITVAGTNGKGSTVAGLEAIYRAAGYRVGAFTSPILFKHNEYVRVNGELATDKEFCDAYEKIAAALNETSLTPFEFHTLAALLIFQRHDLDVLLMEVGLGGRLDAVNILDADLAIITSIGIDHIDYLGPTRESIGKEKAGIFRAQQPAVYGDLEPPTSVLEIAEKLNTKLYRHGKDFQFEEWAEDWSWAYQAIRYEHLPKSSLAIQNMANVLMAITLLQEKLPVNSDAIIQGLQNVQLQGRIQIIPGAITKIVDVAHNPASVGFLSDKLKKLSCDGKTYAVFSMLADKDIVESLKMIRDDINEWFVAPLPVKRAASREQLQDAFKSAQIDTVTFCDSLGQAFVQIIQVAQPGDRVVIFGSFHTVAEVWKMNSGY